MQFDHIGIVVPTPATGRTHLSLLFNIVGWTEEFVDPINDVVVQFARDDAGICYETVAPLGDRSPVLRTLRKADRILNHIAYRVSSLDSECQRLRDLGYIPATKANPAVAYGGHQVQFFISPLRFLIELIEAPIHNYVFLS